MTRIWKHSTCKSEDNFFAFQLRVERKKGVRVILKRTLGVRMKKNLGKKV